MSPQRRAEHRAARAAVASGGLALVVALAVGACNGSSAPTTPAIAPSTSASSPPSGPPSTSPTSSPTPSSTSSPVTPTTGTPTTAPASTSTATAGGRCTAADVHVSAAEAPGGGSAGHYLLNVTITASRGCTLTGYPGVSILTAAGGRQLGAAADRNPAFASHPVTVAAGASAVAVVQVARAGNYDAATCHPTPGAGLRVYLPDDTTPVWAPVAIDACDNPAIHLLEVNPVGATA